MNKEKGRCRNIKWISDMFGLKSSLFIKCYNWKVLKLLIVVFVVSFEKARGSRLEVRGIGWANPWSVYLHSAILARQSASETQHKYPHKFGPNPFENPSIGRVSPVNTSEQSSYRACTRCQPGIQWKFRENSLLLTSQRLKKKFRRAEHRENQVKFKWKVISWTR